MTRKLAKPRTPLARRGWTLWESLVGLNVLGLAVVLFAGLFTSMQETRHEAFARQGAQETLRRNLESVAAVLRTVDVATLDGFDATGSSSRLRFVTLSGDGGSAQALHWCPVAAPVEGVDAPGRVVRVQDGVEVVVAERVPRGAFSVRWDAGMLVVELAAYHVFEDQAQIVHGTTAVLIRN